MFINKNALVCEPKSKKEKVAAILTPPNSLCAVCTGHILLFCTNTSFTFLVCQLSHQLFQQESGHMTQVWKIRPLHLSGNWETRNVKYAGLTLQRKKYVTCFPPRMLGLDVINIMVTCVTCRAGTHLSLPDYATHPWTPQLSAAYNNLPSFFPSSLPLSLLFSCLLFLLSTFCCLLLPSFIPPSALLVFFIRLVSVICR